MIQFRGFAAVASLGAMLGAGTAYAQEAGPATQQGWRITGASVSGTYSTQHLPAGIEGFGDVVIGTGESITAASGVAWFRGSKDSSFGFDYSPLFAVRFGNSNVTSWNHALGAAGTRHFARRWSVSGSLNGAVQSFDESLFAPTSLSIDAKDAQTVQDLNGKLAGNPGEFLPDFSQQTYFFGRKTASLSADGGLSYAASRRLSFDFTIGLNQIRHLNDTSDLPDVRYPKALALRTGVAAEYALSRRTDIGFAAGFIRAGETLSTLEQGGASARVALNHTMRHYWFYDVSVGISADNAKEGNNASLAYSAGVGFKTSSHSALVTYGHQIEDPYVSTIGSGLFVDGTGASYYWMRPRSSWWISSSYGDSRSHFVGLTTVETWEAGVSVGRMFGENYSVTAAYVVGRVGSKRYVQEGQRYQLEQQGARMSFSWIPGQRRRQRTQRPVTQSTLLAPAGDSWMTPQTRPFSSF